MLAPATGVEVVDALRRLAVRGAPAIGVAGAFGVVLGLGEGGPPAPGPTGWPPPGPTWNARRRHARGGPADRGQPALGVRRVAAAAAGAADAAELRRLALAEAVGSWRRAACARMAEAGRAELAARHRLLTHCNTGRLATAGLGTALGVVYAKAAAGEPVQVLASETRPLLQGARLTAWELVTAGIPVTVVADTAAGAAMAGGLVDAVLVGCDRVAANGDTANKIGTYTLAVLADANRIPFYVVGPLSSFDLEAADGAAIEIEQRPAAEVSTLAGAQLAPRRPASGTRPSTSPRPPSSPPSSPTPASSAPFRASIAGALASR